MAVRGLNNVLANLSAAQQQIIADTKRGLRKGGLLVQRESQKLVPVDQGNLKNSAYTEMVGPLVVQVGYTADYALYVHEDMNAAHAVGEAKYLEKAEKATRDQRLDIMAQEASV